MLDKIIKDVDPREDVDRMIGLDELIENDKPSPKTKSIFGSWMDGKYDLVMVVVLVVASFMVGKNIKK